MYLYESFYQKTLIPAYPPAGTVRMFLSIGLYLVSDIKSPFSPSIAWGEVYRSMDGVTDGPKLRATPSDASGRTRNLPKKSINLGEQPNRKLRGKSGPLCRGRKRLHENFKSRLLCENHFVATDKFAFLISRHSSCINFSVAGTFDVSIRSFSNAFKFE